MLRKLQTQGLLNAKLLTSCIKVKMTKMPVDIFIKYADPKEPMWVARASEVTDAKSVLFVALPLD